MADGREKTGEFTAQARDSDDTLTIVVVTPYTLVNMKRVWGQSEFETLDGRRVLQTKKGIFDLDGVEYIGEPPPAP